jgi:hypothetical protein
MKDWEPSTHEYEDKTVTEVELSSPKQAGLNLQVGLMASLYSVPLLRNDL